MDFLFYSADDQKTMLAKNIRGIETEVFRLQLEKSSLEALLASTTPSIASGAADELVNIDGQLERYLAKLSSAKTVLTNIQ